MTAVASQLTGPALQASRAALSSALSDHPGVPSNDDEDGEVQEVDMQAQADGLRTVFSDPTHFNVKVFVFSLPRSCRSLI